MIKTNRTVRAMALGAIVAAAAVAAASPASAQAVAPDARWQGWLGCWQPVSPASGDSYSDWMETRARDTGLPTLCIVPSTTPTAADFVTVAAGAVTARETIDAGRARVARKRDNCDGFEGASWSTDARRIYMTSEYTCEGGVKRTSSGMLAMSGLGQLMDIQEIASGGVKSVRVARYQSVPAPAGLAADSARVPLRDAIPVTAARTAIAGPLTGADIIDAVSNTDSLVVEAWLVERGQRFKVDAVHLAALADAGVPARITDLMIALSYPEVFAFDRTVATRASGGSRAYATVPRADPFGYMSGMGGYPYGYGPLGYDPLRYGYGYRGYGYGGYGGYGYGGYGYLYRPPIVVVRPGPGGGAGGTHGRVVNGRGYERDPSGGSTGSARPRSSGSGGSSGGASSGSSSGSSSSGGSTRHAKPRP